MGGWEAIMGGGEEISPERGKRGTKVRGGGEQGRRRRRSGAAHLGAGGSVPRVEVAIAVAAADC
jgi:hypothetical protein